MTTYKSFADALSAAPATPPTAVKREAANDNKPQPSKRLRSTTTLPALRWLYDNHPELAEPMAKAVKSLSKTLWSPDAVDSDLEIRPTVGELAKAASNGKDDDGNYVWLKPEVKQDKDGNPYIQLGALRFKGNTLVEYGRTAKGRKLKPRDRATPRGEDPSGQRNPNGYLALRGAVASPVEAEPYQHPISADQALAPMYDPQRNVEANRAELRKHGVDSSVKFEDLPLTAYGQRAVRFASGIAKGAEFFGGVVGSSGTASSGAIMWEAPEIAKGEAIKVVEVVASGATLTEIGVRFGVGTTRPDRGAKDVLLDAAKALQVANDNGRKKKAAQHPNPCHF